MGSGVVDLLVPDDEAELYHREWRRFWSGEDTEVAGRGIRSAILTADGRRLPVLTSISRLDVDGTTYGIVAFRDESDMALVEGQARRAAQLFDEFTRNAPVGMYVKDGQGRYVLANPRMEALFETGSDQIIGKTVMGRTLHEDTGDYADVASETDDTVIDQGI